MTTPPTARPRARRAARALRLSRLPPGTGARRRVGARRSRHARRAADRRRQVAVLPGAGAAAAEADRRGLAADLADEGPGRRAHRARHRRPPSSTARSPPAQISDRMARVDARRRQAALRRAGALRLRHHGRAPARRRRVAARGGRGALHQRVGPRFPPELPARWRRCARSSAGRPPSRSPRRRRRTSATDIVAQLRLDNAETIITGFDRQNLRYHVVPTRTDADKDDALVGHPARRTRASPSSTRRRAGTWRRIARTARAARGSPPRRTTPGSTTRIATRCRTRS